MSPILASPLSRKAPNSFIVTPAPCDQQNLFQKYVLDHMKLPFTKVTYSLVFPLPTSMEQSEDLRGCLPGRSPHFAPNKT